MGRAGRHGPHVLACIDLQPGPVKVGRRVGRHCHGVHVLACLGLQPGPVKVGRRVGRHCHGVPVLASSWFVCGVRSFVLDVRVFFSCLLFLLAGLACSLLSIILTLTLALTLTLQLAAHVTLTVTLSLV